VLLACYRNKKANKNFDCEFTNCAKRLSCICLRQMRCLILTTLVAVIVFVGIWNVHEFCLLLQLKTLISAATTRWLEDPRSNSGQRREIVLAFSLKASKVNFFTVFTHDFIGFYQVLVIGMICRCVLVNGLNQQHIARQPLNGHCQ